MTSSEHTTRSHASQRDRQGEEPSEDAARPHKEADRGGEERPRISISVEDAAMMLTRLHPVDRQGEEPSNDATRQLKEANRGGEERPKSPSASMTPQ